MRKVFVLLLVVASLLVSACDPAGEQSAPTPTPTTTPPVELGPVDLIGLTTEGSCADLLGWLKAQASEHGVQSGPTLAGSRDFAAGGRVAALAGESEDTAGAVPAQPLAGTDFSVTNVQEAGVDEPDVVKTDGSRLVALAAGSLRVVDLTGDGPKLTASLPLPGAHGLFLDENRVLAIGSEQTSYPVPTGGFRGVVAPPTHQVTVTVVDIAEPSAPKVAGGVELDGSYVSARMIDGAVRVVLRSSPDALAQRVAVAGDRAAAVIEASTIDDWVPSHVPCERVHHPSGSTGAALVSVVTIDPDDPRPSGGAAVAGAGETVYASAGRLYVTSSDWAAAPEGDIGRPANGPATSIHAFDITDRSGARYVASGSVEGTLLNQFAMSEHEGVLRVATTSNDPATGETTSQVVTLREADGALRPVGSLGGLGRTERIYAVRFLGDLGYVVTFRQTDPLYVVDLSDPAAPSLRGELKIPGFSSYLHPVGEGRLLGIGQNATDQGRRLGSQLSLFDVSDPANPKQLATHDLATYSSGAEYDHHAFLWWPQSSLAVVPVEGFWCPPNAGCAPPPGGASPPGAVGVEVVGERLVERRRLEHPTGVPITRSVVVRGRLLTLSESGLLDSALDTLEPGAWTSF
ncbi:MAG TPA: beta-propeller domain-containing protein [Acidimicrobiales bacterium]|nr:beta-propeller domain-containing protein [Acidimicrobiales bacterium]